MIMLILIYNGILILLTVTAGICYLHIIAFTWFWSDETYIVFFVFSAFFLFILLGAGHMACKAVMLLLIAVELLFMAIVENLENSNEMKFTYWIIFFRHVVLFVLYHFFI
jgi:hypothetical protein